MPSDRATRALWPLKVLLFASILGPLFLYLLAGWYSYRQLYDVAEQKVEEIVGMLHEHALKVLETHELVLARVDEHISGMAWATIGASEDLHHYLERIANELPQIDLIWLIDPDAHARNSSHSFPPPAGAYVADRDYFVALKERDVGTFISQAYPGRTISSVFFNVARRRTSANGAFDGIVLLSISPEYFATFWKTVVASVNDLVLLVRSDGAVLARGPEPLTTPFLMNQQSGLMRMIAQLDEGLFTGKAEIDEVERITGYKKLGKYPLYVEYGLAQEAVLERWYRALAISGAISGITASALFLVSFIALRRAQQEQTAVVRWQETARGLREEIRRREGTEAQLRQAQKMETIGQLTGGIAHDFNNLLTVVLGNLDRIEQGTDDERLRQLARAALEAGERGERLTAHLLAFARRQTLRPEVLNANDVVRSFVDILQRAVGEMVQIELALGSDLWPCVADRVQLEAAVLNLALNGRDAMPEGGRLRIETANIRLAAADLKGNPDAAPGSYVAVTVCDSGRGMPPDVVQRAFEPFFTTKEVGKGSGLGLSMVYGFAQQSGGHAAIESIVGRGTKVTLFLPKAEAAVSISDQLRTSP